MVVAAAKAEPTAGVGQVDLSALSSMLKERWKNGPVAETKADEVRAGQILSFRITKLDAETNTIELQSA